jgi:protein SCO1/2
MKNLKWSFLVVFGLIAIFFGVQRLEPQAERLNIAGQELPAPRDLPPFKLVDSEGSSFELTNLHNKWSIIFFGFSRCTTTCPMVMAYFKSEIAKLSASDLKQLQFVLVSVDPKHDQPEILRVFVKRYDPAIRGVSGSEEELKSLGAGFLTGFTKEQQDPKNVDVYMMAHTPKFFLVDPKGQWRAVYDPPLASGLLAADLQKVLVAKDKANSRSSRDLHALDSSRG